MSQSALEFFRPALEMLRTGKSPVVDTHLTDIVSFFETDKRVNKFFEDMEDALAETGGTLTDADALLMAATQLDGFIKQLTHLKQDLLVKSDTIVERHAEAGTMNADGYVIEPKVGNRVVDEYKVRNSKEFKTFIELKKESLPDTIRITQADLKAMYSKAWQQYLKPGEVIGYNLKLTMPQRAGEVEV